MPTFSRSLEQSLHRALALANERHHEYATLEHLLLALIDDQDAAAVMRACNVDHRQAAAQPRRLSSIRTGEPRHRRRGGLQAHRRLPAGNPARRDPRAVLGSRGGHRRQRARCDLCRAREPCGIFPAGAGDDPLRCGQLHQPWHRQAAGPRRAATGSAASMRRPRQKSRRGARRRKATRWTITASISTRRRGTARSTR